MGVVKIKWTDPPDILTNEPCPATWAGTVVVRKEGSPPRHRWDGTLIVDSTTRDEYSVDALVDDTVEEDKTYYYGIFPYHVALDDANNPIKHYRYTKVVKIVTPSIPAPPIPSPIIPDEYSNAILVLFKANGTVNYGGVMVYNNTYWSCFYVSNSSITINSSGTITSGNPDGHSGGQNRADEYDYTFHSDSYSSRDWSGYPYYSEKIFVNLKGTNNISESLTHYDSWEEYIATL